MWGKACSLQGINNGGFKTCQQESGHQNITLLDIFKAQIQRLTSYAASLRTLAQNTDPLHPDYAHMLRCTAKFEALNQDMTSR
jgi:hypothetical protein